MSNQPDMLATGDLVHYHNDKNDRGVVACAHLDGSYTVLWECGDSDVYNRNQLVKLDD